MATEVIVSDNKVISGETSVPIAVSSGSDYVTQNSSLNSENGIKGVNTADRNEINFRMSITGTMPIGTQVVLTPYYIGEGEGDATTKTLTAAYTDTVAEFSFCDSFIEECDYLKIQYKFKQSTEYTVNSIRVALKKKSAKLQFCKHGIATLHLRRIVQKLFWLIARPVRLR